MADFGETVEDNIGHTDTEPKDCKRVVLTDTGQIVEDSRGNNETETTKRTA